MVNYSQKTTEQINGLSAGILTLFGLFFVITTFLSEYPAASLGCLVGFALLGLYFCIMAPSFLMKYFIVLFGIAAAVAGCFSCEFLDSYLPELQTYASFEGSLPLLILNYFTFLVGLYGFDKMFGSDDRSLLTDVPVRGEQRWFKWIHAGVLLMIGIMFLHVLSNPSFIQGSDRFGYAALQLTGIWRYLHSASMILCIIPLLAVRFGYKKSGYLALALFCLYLFWTGVKFSGFYTLLGLATIIYYDKVAVLNIKIVSRALSGAFVVLGILLGFSVFAHSFAATSDTSFEFFFKRTAQQSELWWSTYRRYSPGQGFDDFSDELSSLGFGEKPISECQGDQYGIYKIMYLNAPSDLVDAKLASGSRYTEAAYPSIYYYFGPIGTISFSVFTAFVTVFLINLMIRVVHGREVLSTLACFIIWRAWGTFRGMFLISAILDPSVLISFLIILLFSRGAYGALTDSTDKQDTRLQSFRENNG